MTIYILGTPQETTQSLDDKSLDKMIREIAQVLCNVHWFECDKKYGGVWKYQSPEFDFYSSKIPLKPKNFTDGWTQWAHECVANYNYLVELGLRLCYEFFRRFLCCGEWESSGCFECGKYRGGAHENEDIIKWAQENMPDLPHYCHSCALCYNETQNGCEFCQEKTLYPVVMPKKYIATLLIKQNQTNILPDYFAIYLAESYCNYYKSKLKPDATWTRREKPKFLEDDYAYAINMFF